MISKQTEIQENIIKAAFDFYKKNKAGYLNLAMRVGKTRCTIEILKKLVPAHATVLIAYPDNKLKTTWESECEKWEYINPNITYVNFSSLKKHTTHIFDVFIIDEYHSTSEKEREYCLEIIKNCEYTLALSGTVSEETVANWGLQEIYCFSTLDGIESNILADYKITVHVIDLDNKQKFKDKQGRLKTEKQKYDGYTWIIDKLKKENKSFMHMALARNRLSLSSVAKKEYVNSLLKNLTNKRVLVFTGLAAVADSIGIASYHSKSKNDEAFQKFQKSELNHLALAAMGKMGVSYPNLDSVILMNFVYSPEENAQILNRCIKVDYEGKIADMHIICLNEKPELKKVKDGLSMLDSSKINYNFEKK